MAKGFKAGAGGGAPLNFKVVGGTSQPSNPKENTIWVNTNIAITNWVFSATQPAAASGRVWIFVGISSPVEFNALKKNSIQVYPLSARQYINGAWTGKTAKIYRGGAWVSVWDGVLLTSTNTYYDYTGGWVTDARLSPYNDSNREGLAPKLTNMGEGKIRIAIDYSQKKGCYRTVNKVDVSAFKTLKCDFSSTEVPNGVVMFSLIDKLDVGVASNSAANAYVASGNNPNFSGTISLDISNINGEYYIAISMCTYTATQYTTATITKVYLE